MLLILDNLMEQLTDAPRAVGEPSRTRAALPSSRPRASAAASDRRVPARPVPPLEIPAAPVPGGSSRLGCGERSPF